MQAWARVPARVLGSLQGKLLAAQALQVQLVAVVWVVPTMLQVDEWEALLAGWWAARLLTEIGRTSVDF